MDNLGGYLEVVPDQRLLFTTALGPGYRPQDHYIRFTAVITLEPKDKGRGTMCSSATRTRRLRSTREDGISRGMEQGAGPDRRDGEHRMAGALEPDVTRPGPLTRRGLPRHH